MIEEKENPEESNEPGSSESQPSESSSAESGSSAQDPQPEPVPVPPPAPEPAASEPPPAAAAASADAELAGPGDRFLAALIDGILVFVVSLVPILGWIVGFGYQLTKDALPFLGGQSIGKKAMKLRVVNDETNEPITNDYGAAVVRAVSLMIPIFGIVDAFMVFSSDRKRFGDKWAKTKVIKEAA